MQKSFNLANFQISVTDGIVILVELPNLPAAVELYRYQ